MSTDTIDNAELQFSPSIPLTLGVELELQVLNPQTYDLTPQANHLIDLLNKQPLTGRVCSEVTQGIIELNSSKHESYSSLLTELKAHQDQLLKAAQQLHLALSGGGTHPFQKWHRQRISDTPRYHRVSQLYGYLAKQFTVFGQHIHIGFSDPDQALRCALLFARYTPHFIA
ncbi:MAG TPA: glutamate-cysteine ligase family protein, partial [Opitutales bacterium]|nr:glutamate-cysteine ligase family protein [Opitutales bacterium]